MRISMLPCKNDQETEIGTTPQRSHKRSISMNHFNTPTGLASKSRRDIHTQELIGRDKLIKRDKKDDRKKKGRSRYKS